VDGFVNDAGFPIYVYRVKLKPAYQGVFQGWLNDQLDCKGTSIYRRPRIGGATWSKWWEEPHRGIERTSSDEYDFVNQHVRTSYNQAAELFKQQLITDRLENGSMGLLGIAVVEYKFIRNFRKVQPDEIRQNYVLTKATLDKLKNQTHRLVYGTPAGLINGTNPHKDVSVETTREGQDFTDCSKQAVSPNGLSKPRGCAGAVYGGGAPSRRYCAGKDNKDVLRFPWLKKCCRWNSSSKKCVNK